MKNFIYNCLERIDERMIVVRLIGGLGNQMFQYAFARALSLKRQTELKLDLASYGEDTPRSFSLDCFNIKASFASLEEIKKLVFTPTPLFIRIVRKIKGKPPMRESSQIYRERHYHFDPQALGILGDSYLIGYWQSEKYFYQIEDIIRRDFTFKSKMSKKNQLLAKRIQETDSVSIHVRRADYVTNKVYRDYFKLCGIEYYFLAITKMINKVHHPCFYVFSDDLDWVKNNIQSEFPITYIDHNRGNQDYEDMRLMSLCKHHIIANSSFSWWGAWLNMHPDKIVIAPKKWFNDPSINTKDLIPSSWIRI